MSQQILSTEDMGKCFIIRLPALSGSNIKSSIESEMSTWLIKPNTLFLVDMRAVSVFEPALYSSFGNFSKTLKKNEKFFCSFGANEKIFKQITADGMDTTFGLVKTSDEAYKVAGFVTEKKKIALDLNIVNPFIAAAINTFKVQCQTEASAGKPFLHKRGGSADVGIAGVINVVCPEFKGSISIAFPSKVFLKIYENMRGKKQEEITDDVKDGAAELLNIIYGQGKTELVAKGFKLEKELSTVLVGEELISHRSKQAASIIIPLTSSVGDFSIEVSLNDD